MVIFTPTWQNGQFDPASGSFVSDITKACASFPPDRAIDGWANISPISNASLGSLVSFNAYYISHSNDVILIGSDLSSLIIDDEILSQSQTVFINMNGSLPLGVMANVLMPTLYNFIISNYYFLESSLQMYITAQQLEQFKYMYPRCVEDAYRSAKGKLTAQIGNRFDMDAMLGETDELKKDDTICWILQVLTAYFICSPTMSISQTLDDANKEVTSIIGQLKGGQVSLEEPAPYREDAYSAAPVIVSTRLKYLG